MSIYLSIYNKLKKFKHRKPEIIKDDFDWDIYGIHYRGELADLSRIYTLALKKDDYTPQSCTIVKTNTEILPLNPYHIVLYETILNLKPKSVMELGCGGGDHLNNISVLFPEMYLIGVDLVSSQLKFMADRHPELKAKVMQFDITLPMPYEAPKVDLVFTQSVLMHIFSGNGHLVALANLFRCSSEYVVLMENCTRHKFIDDIVRLFDLRIIPWQSIYVYYRKLDFHKPNRADVLIASVHPIKYYDEFLVIEKNYKNVKRDTTDPAGK